MSFVETIHGRKLADPFHWLEGAEVGEVASWMSAQQSLTDKVIGQTQHEHDICRWLSGFLDKPFVFHAFDAGAYRFALEEQPGKEQPILLRVSVDGGSRRTVVDPSEMMVEGDAVILDQESIAANSSGSHVAFSLKKAASPGSSLFIRNVETGQLETVEFPLNVLPSVSWHPLGHGFYYNQCQGEFIAGADRIARPDGVYWHELDAPLASDRLVYRMDWPDAHTAIPAVSADGCFLFIKLIRLVANVCRLRALPLDTHGAPTGTPIALAEDDKAGFCYIGVSRGLHYFETNLGAPNGRVIGFDLRNNCSYDIVEAVCEKSLPLCMSPRAVRAERSVIANERLYLTYLDGSGHLLCEHNFDDESPRYLPLPEGAAIAGSGGDRFGRLSVAASGSALIVDIWRRTVPPCSYIYDTASQALTLAVPYSEPHALSNVTIKHIRCHSKDRTPVPMTILSLGEFPRDGTRPCLLYGYGGFGMAIVPEFGLDTVAWLAMGGIYVVANIRGGGEFGTRWHEAGKGADKQNSFDDFIAAAEYLIGEGIARPGCLAIRGLSNGGLLTGACITQRPDMFGAVIAELPLLDPLRMGRDYWSAQIAPELGNPTADEAAFDVIARYSPLESLRDEVVYPPTLIVAADKDAQLLMDGARKFVATLQLSGRHGGPHLLHVVRDAAHGGWTKSQQLNTTSRELAFLVQALGKSVRFRKLDN